VRCGSDTAPRTTDTALLEHGFWDEDWEDDWNGRPEYSEVHHRPAHLRRLEGHGQPPTPDELVELPWPQREWWNDRDRIVLLHEYVGSWPPMGHTYWELHLHYRAMTLWNVWDHSQAQRTFDITLRKDKVEAIPQGVDAGTKLWKDVPAPGYRMLTSFPCCPRSLRPLMSPALLARSRLTDEGRAADKWGSLPQWLVHERQDAERASAVPDSEWDSPRLEHNPDECVCCTWRQDARTVDRDGNDITDIRGWTMSTT